MGFLSDGRKALRLLRRALASRSATLRVRRRLEMHEPGAFQIAIYFADTGVNMYQIRQWYKPLEELAKRWPIVVLSRSSVGAEALLDDAVLPVAFVPSVHDLEKYVAAQDIRLVFYVNQNTRNFQMFRFGRRWHVFINHGESDKVYMVSNQFKAYDFALIAGQAAHDRLARAQWDYDVDRRTIEIGRPQADHYLAETPYPADEREVVLYAPTWEGDRASMSYGSVLTHGERIVGELLSTGRHRVIYRPHPRSGVNVDAYGAANKRIIAAIARANEADPTARHVYDDGPELGWQLAAADVAIVDISAMIYDRLATGKPLMVTRPVDLRATVDASGYLADCEWLTADAAADVVAEVKRVRADDVAIARLDKWARHYFGDTTKGVATAKFHAAVEQLMAHWEEWHRAEISAPRVAAMNLPRAAAVASRLEVVAESASTNADLRAHAADAEAWPHLAVLLTANQTAGRGRLDRSWVAPAGTALAISVLLRDLPTRAEAFGWIPLAAGVAMSDAVSAQLPEHEVGVKWPNDVLVDGRKICGILAESTGDAVILGSGINTAMTAEQLPVPTATSFGALGAVVDDDRLIADYLRRLSDLLAALAAAQDAEASGLHRAVSERCLTIGRTVNVALPDGSTLRGLATRLETDGRLALDVDGVEHVVAAGDVVHARLS